MRRSLLCQPLACGALLASMLAPATVFAQTATAPATDSFSLSGSLSTNLAFTSDYRFRGVSQTFGDPALQGGVDLTLPSNFYLGAWASVVDKEIYANSRGFELDIYGGYKWQLREGLVVDLGLLQYIYPTESDYSTLEGYVGVSYQWLSFKYSHSLSNRFFGVSDARGSQYYDLTAIYPLGDGINVIGHYGVQEIASNSGDYSDYRVGLTKDWMGATWGLSYYGTDSDFDFTNRAGRTRDLGEGGFVFSVSKTF